MLLVSFLAASLATAQTPTQTQTRTQTDSTAFFRALDLEGAGKHREAAALFRSALNGPSAISALLGLERSYYELGWTDSLLAPLDTLIRRSPAEPMLRAVQLRSLQALGRDSAMRAAFEKWVGDLPKNPAPYREYARLASPF